VLRLAQEDRCHALRKTGATHLNESGHCEVIAGLSRHSCGLIGIPVPGVWTSDQHQVLQQLFNSCPFVFIRGPATRFSNHEWTRMNTKVIEKLPRDLRTSTSVRVDSD
jgi:hypothetical protein